MTEDDPSSGQMANLHLDEVTGEKVRFVLHLQRNLNL